MPGLAVRAFDCTLCGQRFSLLAGDLILRDLERRAFE